MKQTLEFNRDLKIRRSRIKEETFGVKKNYGEFEPIVELSSSFSEERRGQFTRGNLYDQTKDSYRAQVQKLFQNGDRISLNLSTSRDELTGFTSRRTTDQYESSLNLRYVKPLFEGGGRDVTLSNIRRAKIRRTLVRQRYKNRVDEVLFNVFQAYFDLYQAKQELQIQREILGFTERIKKVVEKKVSKRTLPVIAQTQVEASYLTQKNQIASLKNEVRRKQYKLMISIFSDPRVRGNTKILLQTGPAPLMDTGAILPEEKTLNRVLENDIELIRLRHDRKLLQQDRIEAKDQLEPELTLTSEAGIDGYDFGSGDSSRESAFDNLSEENYHFELQARLSFPWNNKTAKNRLAEISEQMRQIQIQIENRSDQLRKVVAELYDDLETVRNQLNQSKEISRLSKKNLNQEIKRLVAGKSTVLDTLQFQRDFSQARLSLLSRRIRFVQLKGTYYLLRREMKEMLGKLKS